MTKASTVSPRPRRGKRVCAQRSSTAKHTVNTESGIVRPPIMSARF